MKGQLPVRTAAQYLAHLDEPRRSEVARLHRLIRATVPRLEHRIMAGMLAYGPVHYRYASGREGDAARLAVASNANSIALYVFAADDKGWVAERYRKDLPNAKVGKSCINFKRLDDLDLATLKRLFREAATSTFPAHGGEVVDTGRKRTRTTAARRGRTSAARARPRR
jgi:hypothetical protein